MDNNVSYQELLKKHGSKRAAARAIGIPESTFRLRLKKEEQAQAFNKLGLKIVDAEAAVMDGLDVKGTSRYYKLEDGGVWIKTDKEKQSLLSAVEALIDESKSDLPEIKDLSPPENYNKDLACVIPIADAHVGMLSWGEETGDDFDLNIAKRNICGAFKYLIDQGPQCSVCVIANLGDYFHYSGMESKTDRSGHILDADSRAQKMVKVGIAALRFCIEYAAAKHDKIVVINSSGNHDGLLGHTLNILMANIYENHERIEVNDKPTSRHYYDFGKNLFGFVHGHQTKDKDLPGVMATEHPVLWGKTKHRTWYRGHHHYDSRVEYLGCFVEQVRTLSAGDAYAVGGGYLSGRDLKQIVYHREYGEQSRIICGIDLLKSLQSESLV